MTRALMAGLVAIAALLAAAPAPAATNECRGLNPCAPIAGPWVVVPTARSLPRPQVQWQLTCPRGYVVGGVDVELSDRAIDVSFLGSSGSPVSPGVTTSRSVVFVGTYVGGRTAMPPTFRPHAGCVPARGGGTRTPTGVTAVFPPGEPTVRRVVTERVTRIRTIVAACRAGERLVAWFSARGFLVKTPPSAALVRGVTVSGGARGDRVVVIARGRVGVVVQVSVVCAVGSE